MGTSPAPSALRLHSDTATGQGAILPMLALPAAWAPRSWAARAGGQQRQQPAGAGACLKGEVFSRRLPLVPRVLLRGQAEAASPAAVLCLLPWLCRQRIPLAGAETGVGLGLVLLCQWQWLPIVFTSSTAAIWASPGINQEALWSLPGIGTDFTLGTVPGPLLSSDPSPFPAPEGPRSLGITLNAINPWSLSPSPRIWRTQRPGPPKGSEPWLPAAFAPVSASEVLIP